MLICGKITVTIKGEIILAIFWLDDETLYVDGKKMTPEVALKEHPEHSKTITDLVNTRDLHEKERNPFEPEEDFKPAVEKDIDICLKEIGEKTNKIFKKLGIEASSDFITNYNNAYSLFKYVVENSKYDKNIMLEKAVSPDDLFDMEVRDIHKCLCEGRSVCTSDAATLAFLYKTIGIESYHVTIADKNSDEPEHVHEVVKFNLGGEDAFCDPTLTRTLIEKGIIANVDEALFAIDNDKFFGILYPDLEIKYEHTDALQPAPIEKPKEDPEQSQ